jgi:hypothetical protein
MELNNEYSKFIEDKIDSKEFQDRFWAKVKKQGRRGCWLWTGATSNGSGLLLVRDSTDMQPDGRGKPRTIVVHRLAWRIEHGKWPPRWALHECDTRTCVNPGHLKDGDHAASQAQRAEHGRTAKHFGEDNGRSKLSKADVLDIRKRLARGEKASVLGVEYEIDESYVRQIERRENWKHI